MSSPQEIQQIFAKSMNISDSPNRVSKSPVQSFMSTLPHRQSVSKQKVLKPFFSGDIKILLLENVNKTAIDILTKQGYQVEFHKSSLDEETLIEKIKDVHCIGIRSKTKLTAKVLSYAKNLVAIGCFCIGTNQVDLEYATKIGAAVFNSPFSNSRSVAELIMAEIVCLARQVGDRSIELHTGTWNKVSNKCWEVRGKTLGIIGYGHIGSQLSVLAEAFGMHVIYYDVVTIMSIGMAKQVEDFNEFLGQADFLTCHVPETPETKNLLSLPQFAAMKDGSYVLNASRGTVVDIPALVQAIKVGKIAGAALDVYPHEPPKNGEALFVDSLNDWTSELYINEGNSVGSVNFPEVSLRGLSLDQENTVRVLYIHQNVPGVLKVVNNILSDHNIEKQFSDSQNDIAYLIADISNVDTKDIKDIYDKLNATDAKIAIRLLY
ncbi:unnamed protein product [Hanseniaspora opuntiae]